MSALCECCLSSSCLVVAETEVSTDTGKYAYRYQAVGLVATDDVSKVGCNVDSRSYIVPFPLINCSSKLKCCLALPCIEGEACTKLRAEVVAHCKLSCGRKELSKRGLAKCFLHTKLALNVPVWIECSDLLVLSSGEKAAQNK